MQVLTDIRAVPAGCRSGVIAIGNFDGVHRGHKRVLADLKARAVSLGGPAGVMMFEPHPREFFRPGQTIFRITPRREQLRILGELGIDLAVIVPFDRALADLSAGAFIDSVLVEALGVRHVVVGHDFQFGKGRSGTIETLRVAGERYGFGVTEIAAQRDGQEVISSSRIRECLATGKVEAAANLLGHWWRVTGTVTGGAKRGTGLGFPTANILIDRRQALAHGIYAAFVVIDGTRHSAAAYLGTRPTFDNGDPVLETFLFDFDEDLYGREIGVEFLRRLRGDQGFTSVDALVQQMARDCDDSRAVIAALAADDPRHRLVLPPMIGN